MIDPIYSTSDPGVEQVAAGMSQLINQAKSLGLTWTLRMATIQNAVDPENIAGILDGDLQPLLMTNMTGTMLDSGMRVYVLLIPPAGNFIVGVNEAVVLGTGCGTAESMTAGTTASATYTDQPGSPSVFITKRYNDTYLRFSWAQTYYTTGGDINALFGAITSSGLQVFLAKNFTVTTAGFRIPISGVSASAGIPAGRLEWIGAWAQAGGGVGTLTVDSGCFWSMCIEEFWPSD
jgi:hypothetical protein